MATGDKIFLADKATLDSVNAKLDQILEFNSKLSTMISFDSSGNMLGLRTVKKVINFNNIPVLEGQVSATVTHEAVDMNKSFIIINSSEADNSTSFTNRSGVRITARTSTSFTISSFANEARVQCQLVEFY